MFLKLQLYVHSSLVARANQKLAFKFFGPFKIIRKVGDVAYRLLLPDSTTVQCTLCFMFPLLEWSVPQQILQRRVRVRPSACSLVAHARRLDYMGRR